MNATFLLLLGLLIFLGSHSVRIVADGWRNAMVARFGPWGWKALFSLPSLLGFALLAWGYAETRAAPVVLWLPPTWTRHLASLLTLPAFVLIAAAYIPGNRLKATFGHPMVAGVKLWALAHLLTNGNLADVLLFGGFLVWAAFSFRAARRRDRAAGTTYLAGPAARTAWTIIVGITLWASFAVLLHAPLIGVRPF